VRLAISRYASRAAPTLIKRVASQSFHLDAPLKGLNLDGAMAPSDPRTATILDNWVVEESRILQRPGIRLYRELAAVAPITSLIPYYGPLQTFLMAQGGSLFTLAGAALSSGFDPQSSWHWTSFANLSQVQYTVLVNGFDGVWSWDGGLAGNGVVTPITSLSNANPAVATVAAGDISRFSNGMVVAIAGADASHAAANGTHTISSVGAPANTFRLDGVDTSSAGGPQTTGATAQPMGSLVKESVTAPAGKIYIQPNRFDKVLVHMNRLWFADTSTLSLYYLPLQQKSGELKELPLNALFKRGGFIMGMYTWTLDGGTGVDDQLVIFSSNGEAVVYSGTDPDADFNLTGIFRFDSPMSKHSVINYGGDLYVLTGSGLLPMTTLIRAESEQLGRNDKKVLSLFRDAALNQRATRGWGLILDHTSGRMICNMPAGGTNHYRQLVRFMPEPIWASWSALPARCWQWIDNQLLMGSDDGKVYIMDPLALNDAGKPITVDVQMAWSNFKTPAFKAFKMIYAYIVTDGLPRPFIDMRVDYDSALPTNQPDVTQADLGATWDVATWDVDYWAATPKARGFWQGVAAKGKVAAPRLRANIVNCTFAVSGFDVIFEPGAIMG
jgi:hypothetical protein